MNSNNPYKHGDSCFLVDPDRPPDAPEACAIPG